MAMSAVTRLHGRVRDPWSPRGRTTRLVLLALWVAYTAVLAALYSRLPPCPDHAVYDYIGWMVSQGAVLYADVAGQNWPGQMFLHILSVSLFGNEISSYRAFELLLILPTACVMLFTFLRRYGDEVAAWLVVPIYQAMYVTAGFWISGQREIVAAPLLLAASYCLLRRTEDAGRKYLVLQGLCLAGAALIRPTLLIMAPLLTLADLLIVKGTGRSLREIVEDHTVVAISTVAPLAVIAVMGIPSGALQAWYDVTVSFNLEVYSRSRTPWEIAGRLLPWMLRSWHWYLFVSLLGVVYYWRRDLPALIAVGMIIPATILSVLIQGKGFEYHLGTLFPLFALLVASVVGASWRYLATEKRRLLPSTLALLLIAIPAAGLAKRVWSGLGLQREHYFGRITKAEMYSHYGTGVEGLNVNELLEIAEYVESTSAPDAAILFWERPCQVYYWAERRSAFFAASFALLEMPEPDFSLFERWKARLEEAMVSRPPALLLLVKDKERGGYRALSSPDHREEKLADVILQHLPEYQLEESIGLVDIYRLSRKRLRGSSAEGTSS